MKNKPKKKKNELQKLRAEWKELIKDKSKDEIFKLENSFINKAYCVTTGKKDKRVEVSHVNAGGFLVVNVITGREYRLPPWHLLYAKKIKKKTLCRIRQGKQNPDKLQCHYYQLIYKHWENYLAVEIPKFEKLGDAVKTSRQKITEKFCNCYEGTQSYIIWHDALIDLSRKMHPTYIPTNSKGEEFWDSNNRI